jgi:CheY-like chemotaxis protein
MKNVPKLILLDIFLPDITGYEVCQRIRAHEEFKKIPLFYITAVPEGEVSEKVKETGADGYFLKPFDITSFTQLFEYL